MSSIHVLKRTILFSLAIDLLLCCQVGMAATYENYFGDLFSREDYDCSKVHWTKFEHTYGLDSLSYEFHGTWYQEWFTTIDLKTESGLQKWDITVHAEYTPSTKHVHESTSFHGITPTNRPLYVIDEVSGQSSSGDPWTSLVAPTVAITGEEWTQPQRGGNPPVMGWYDVPPHPGLMATCALPPEIKTEWFREALEIRPPECSVEEIRVPPTITAPTNNQRFEQPQDVVVGLQINCHWPGDGARPEGYLNRFTLDLEKQFWDGGAYALIWIPCPDCSENYRTAAPVSMAFEDHSVGGINLGLEKTGRYRLRAKNTGYSQSAEDGSFQSAHSDFTDWVYFSVGDDAAAIKGPEMHPGKKPEDPQQGLTNTRTSAKPIAARPSDNQSVQLQEKKELKPDFAVSLYKLNESSTTPKTIQPTWLVQNIGTMAAPTPEILLCCRCKGEVACTCPSSFGNPGSFGKQSPDSGWDYCRLESLDYDAMLFPRPEGGGGSVVGRNGPLLNEPPAGAHYEILAQVDPSNKIPELNDSGNNKMLFFYPEKAFSGDAGQAAALEEDTRMPHLVNTSQAIGKVEKETPHLEASSTAIGKIEKDYPDLALEFAAVASQNPAYAGRYVLIFTVTNRGTVASGPATFTVSCFPADGSGPCPALFEPSYRLPPLEPGKNWLAVAPATLEGLVSPPAQGEYHFLAYVDGDYEVMEGEGEGNNGMLAIFPERKTPAEQIITPELREKLSGLKDSEIILGKAESNVALGNTQPVQGALQGMAGTSVSKTSTPQNLSASAIKKPEIWFDLRIKPKSQPQINIPFDIVIGLRNTGDWANGNSGSNRVVARLACVPLDGGICEKQIGDPVVPTVAPGNQFTWHLGSVFKATKAGKYRVTLNLVPEPRLKEGMSQQDGNIKSSYSFDFTLLSENISPTRKAPSAEAMTIKQGGMTGAPKTSGNTSAEAAKQKNKKEAPQPASSNKGVPIIKKPGSSSNMTQ